jgi:hypothetical protein
MVGLRAASANESMLGTRDDIFFKGIEKKGAFSDQF